MFRFEACVGLSRSAQGLSCAGQVRRTGVAFHMVISTLLIRFWWTLQAPERAPYSGTDACQTHLRKTRDNQN